MLVRETAARSNTVGGGRSVAAAAVAVKVVVTAVVAVEVVVTAVVEVTQSAGEGVVVGAVIGGVVIVSVVSVVAAPALSVEWTRRGNISGGGGGGGGGDAARLVAGEVERDATFSFKHVGRAFFLGL